MKTNRINKEQTDISFGRMALLAFRGILIAAVFCLIYMEPLEGSTSWYKEMAESKIYAIVLCFIYWLTIKIEKDHERDS